MNRVESRESKVRVRKHITTIYGNDSTIRELPKIEKWLNYEEMEGMSDFRSSVLSGETSSSTSQFTSSF